MTDWRKLSIVLGLLAACGMTACPTSDVDRTGESKPAAPDFELVQLDGQPIRLADLRGKIVILDFWATWCHPCEVQMPVLDAMWRESLEAGGDASSGLLDDLMIVGLSVDTAGLLSPYRF